MTLATFDLDHVRSRAQGFGTQQLVAFAAFWAQRLIPMYERFSSVRHFGSVAEIQRGLDLAWFAAGTSAHISESEVSAWEERLLQLAPNLEVSPILAYSAMECASATWEALAASNGNSIDHAMEAADSYRLAVLQYLGYRDHRGHLIAIKDSDPLNLLSDPIWDSEVEALNDVLEKVSAKPMPSPQATEALKARAKDGAVMRIVEAMYRLDVTLSSAGGVDPFSQTP